MKAPIKLRIYEGVDGPVGYDREGHTFPMMVIGGELQPMVSGKSFVIVKRFADEA